MFLVKVKAHGGEVANKEANIQVDKAISSKEFPMALSIARQDKLSSLHMTGASPE